jgi:glycerol-3-phosphate dehydrogenase
LSQFDIAIIGGGITGLWLSAILKANGFHCVLFEKDALGAGQTLASQGILHGGTKYALTGKLTGSSEAVRAMPSRWKQHLTGDASPDLSQVKINSDHQWMWAAGGMSSRVASFFASKVMSSRVNVVDAKRLPDLLANKTVYQLDEPVLDVKSLLEQLRMTAGDNLYRARVENVTNQNEGLHLVLGDGDSDEKLEVNAKAVIFTAGEGNETLQSQQMQRRPLHMIMVKGRLPGIWAHVIEANANPRMTITSHYSKEGETVWYIGGQLAEDGTARDDREQIRFAAEQLSAIIPGIDWHAMQWSTLKVNRAEGKQPDTRRPDNPVIIKDERKFTIWPTKLVFAPLVADIVLEHLQTLGIGPDAIQGKLALPAAEVGEYPWDNATWVAGTG